MVSERFTAMAFPFGEHETPLFWPAQIGRYNETRVTETGNLSSNLIPDRLKIEMIGVNYALHS